MNGKIGNIVKRENSTKSDFVSVDIVLNLKDSASIINPIVIVDTTVNAYEYNYLYIAQFSRFYFIRDCKWILGVWELTCECDVLASWKTTILNTNKFVLRSSSLFDTEIIDTLYPSKASAISKHEISERLTGWGGSGSYIISTISSTPYAMGSITYYVCSAKQAQDFINFMLSGVPDWNSITDFSGDVAKAFIDPFQYVTGCMFFPFEIPENHTAVSTIKFGFWDSKISARPLLNPQQTFNVQLTLPSSNDSRIFTNYEPYAEYWLDAGAFGIVPLRRKWFETETVYIYVDVDLVNGNAKMTVGNSANPLVNPLTVSVAKIGATMAIAGTQFKTDISLGGLVETAIGAATGAVSALISDGDVLSSATSNMIKAQVSGINEGIVSAQNSGVITLVGMFLNMTDEDVDENGRPCFKTVQLKTLSGFCKVDDGLIKGNMLIEEQRKIRDYLEGGFFIE